MTTTFSTCRDTWLEVPLREAGILSPSTQGRVQAMGSSSLWSAVVAARLATDQQILQLLSRRYRTEIADDTPPSPDMRTLIDEDVARRLGVVPLRKVGRQLFVATDNPVDARLEDAVAFAAGQRVRLMLASAHTIERWQDALYAGPADVSDLIRAAGPVKSGEGLVRDLRTLSTQEMDAVSATDLVNALIMQAVQRRASDIHLEPHETAFGVRYRVDGALHHVAMLPRSLMASVTSRLKVLADLDIADRLRPQDGRAQVQMGSRRIDLRISTLPLGPLGEKTVIRILDQGGTQITLDALGFLPEELARVHSLFQAKSGMILVTGPTGSGKTTTLYTALGMLRSEGVNIVTVEDPVEYRLDGITQVQTNERAGLTFASALRSILRQDPDVVLVGEVRDKETAEMAIRASLTGHVVLSTLHTNDAPSTIMRLVDMGVDVQAMSSALRGVMAQRLLRRLCEHCRSPVDRTSLAVAQQALLADLEDVSLFEAVGCPNCDHVGYKGRLVVPEIVQITPDLERAIAEQASPHDVLHLCEEAGMVDLWHAGLKRVALGLTTLNELLDTITPPAPLTFEEAPQEDVDAIFTAHAAEPTASGWGADRGTSWMAGPTTPVLFNESQFVLIDNRGGTH